MSLMQTNPSTKGTVKTKKDPAAERIVIGGLLQYGEELFYEIDTLIEEDQFQVVENKLTYAVIKRLIAENKVPKPQLSSVVTLLKQENHKFNVDVEQYLDACYSYITTVPEAILMAQRVARLAILNTFIGTLTHTAKSLESMSGDESLNSILAAAESPITAFTDKILDNGDTSYVPNNIDSFYERLLSSEHTQIGIPSGFKQYDDAIGGGFRFGVNVIGGRPKAGKSSLAVQIILNVCGRSIPVLYLDTELSEDLITTKLLANVSNVTINDIESKKFVGNDYKETHVLNGIKSLKNNKFWYQNISGKSHHQWLSIMRRWIHKDVGFKPDGTAKDCLIILDYLKTMNLSEMGQAKEYQYLGQIITDLHNFCVKYKVPMLSFVQLNREGIENSGQGVIADSDRIMRLCVSFAIFRKKNEADIVADPTIHGNRKLEVVDCRYGPGLPDGYINMHCNYECCSIKEGKIFNGIVQPRSNKGSSQSAPAGNSQPADDWDNVFDPTN